MLSSRLPFSLSLEPSDCLDSLEEALSDWLGHGGVEVAGQRLEDSNASGRVEDATNMQERKEKAAAALVALACARGSFRGLLHTVHLLQQERDLAPLPVAPLIYRLLKSEESVCTPLDFGASQLDISWGYNDGLLPSETPEAGPGRSAVTDGKFIFLTNGCGCGISKLGSGLHGTLRGWVYAKNTGLEASWLGWTFGHLFSRPLSYDDHPSALINILDSNSLQVLVSVLLPFDPITPAPCTLHLASDMGRFYWIWTTKSDNQTGVKGQRPVFVDTFELLGDHKVESIGERVVLNCCPGPDDHSFVPGYNSNTPEFHGASPRDNGAMQSVPSLVELCRNPMYILDSNLVVLSSTIGTTSNMARSLFTSPSAFLSPKGQWMAFSLKDGHQVGHGETSIPFAKDKNPGYLGLAYDSTSDILWCCNGDSIDQLSGSRKMAAHLVCKHLRLDPVSLPSQDKHFSIASVIRSLLRYMAVSTYQELRMGVEIFDNTSNSCDWLQLLCWAWQVGERAVALADQTATLCVLIVMQHLFHRFEAYQMQENDEVVKMSAKGMRVKDGVVVFLWNIVENFDWRDICSQACETISTGLFILYPEEVMITRLLGQLITKGEDEECIRGLRDNVLLYLAERLGGEDEGVHGGHLPEEMVSLIVQVAVSEACTLIGQSAIMPLPQFCQLLNSVPVWSPCLRYLSALQSFVLSSAVLFPASASDDSDSSLHGETLKDFQDAVLRLAGTVLPACQDVLTFSQSLAQQILNSHCSSISIRLEALETLIRHSMVGCLIPSLLTTLCHPQLLCLSFAQSLLPILTRLYLLTGKISLHVRQQDEESTARQNESPDRFLHGIKIPQPWAFGRRIETEHPVRDNYHFRDTFTVPGARSLFLLFDSRCSTQYDYDKLTVYAGIGTGGRKVGEYGGNSQGFGGHTALGSAWPKKLVRVVGDSVTFVFEVKSGREYNTPDSIVWGFACTVRAQENEEEGEGGLPFLVDITLTLASLSCSLLHVLNRGPDMTPEEETCKELLSSELLQRCQWQLEPSGIICATPSPSPLSLHPMLPGHSGNFDFPPSTPEAQSVTSSPPGFLEAFPTFPRVRLPPSLLSLLRSFAPHSNLLFRPSIHAILQPDVLEELIMSCVLKHFQLHGTLAAIVGGLQHSTNLHQDKDGQKPELMEEMEGKEKWCVGEEDVDEIDTPGKKNHQRKHGERKVKKQRLAMKKVQHIGRKSETQRIEQEKRVKDKAEVDKKQEVIKSAPKQIGLHESNHGKMEKENQKSGRKHDQESQETDEDKQRAVDKLELRKSARVEQESNAEVDRLKLIIKETYTRLDALQRQLQNVAELEQRWEQAVEDEAGASNTILTSSSTNYDSTLNCTFPFFEYHLHEIQIKEMRLLCFLLGKQFDEDDLEHSTRSLREAFTENVMEKKKSADKVRQASLLRTRRLVRGVINRALLLLQVSISPQPPNSPARTHNACEVGGSTCSPLTPHRSFSDVLSHDPCDRVIEYGYKAREKGKEFSQSTQFIVRGEDEVFFQLNLLFCFLGSKPHSGVSSNSFLCAASTRFRRGDARCIALVLSRELLTAARTLSMSSLVLPQLATLLQDGPRISELQCGGMVDQ
uniref:HECT domain-containing protein n=1 Tax=Eptatretus burgeri TaxID=7764 RepID=A0A8C4Q6L6_EPTBU